MFKQYDSMYKIVLLGAAGVGKTSIHTQIMNQTFTTKYQTTIGTNVNFKKLEVDRKNIKLVVWDTAGQEKFHSMTGIYLRKAQAVLFVFDLGNPQSLEAIIQFWLDEVLKYVEEELLMAIIGNKSDMPKRVSEDIIKRFCEKNKMRYFQCTATDYATCQRIFVEITKDLEKREKEQSQISQKVNVELSNQQDNRKEKKCC